MLSFWRLILIIVGVAAQSAHAGIALRHPLLSTNELYESGLRPLEGEILYDVVTGGLMARINGRDVLLPSVPIGDMSRMADVQGEGGSVKSNDKMRTVLLPFESISAPEEGEIALDVAAKRVVVWRAEGWRPLGKLVPRAGDVQQRGLRRFRHILPSITDISLQSGELAVDFVNETVWLGVGGEQFDLRSAVP